jgi:hypothetical protein
MATSGSENNENLQPGEGANNQQAAAAAGGGNDPPKSAKQLEKEAKNAEKLRKFNEKQEAKKIQEEQV